MNQKEITFEFTSPQHGEVSLKFSDIVSMSFCELYGSPGLRIYAKEHKVCELGFANEEQRKAMYQEFKDQLDVRTFNVTGWVMKSNDGKQSGIPPR